MLLANLICMISLNLAYGSTVGELEVKNVSMKICSSNYTFCSNISEFTVYFNPCDIRANSYSRIKIEFRIKDRESDILINVHGYLANNGSVFPDQSSTIDERRTKM
jgi:hypothetical protein